MLETIEGEIRPSVGMIRHQKFIFQISARVQYEEREDAFITLRFKEAVIFLLAGKMSQFARLRKGLFRQGLPV